MPDEGAVWEVGRGLPMQIGWAPGARASLTPSAPTAGMPPWSVMKGSCRPSDVPARHASGWAACVEAAATREGRSQQGGKG